MNKVLFGLLIVLCLVVAVGCEESEAGKALKGSSYFIDPVSGDDSNSGISAQQAWKSFDKINQMPLMAGDSVNVQPGKYDGTLRLSGAGTAKQPVVVNFAPGRYDIFDTKAIRKKFHISNTNGEPDLPKAMAILLDGVKHFKLIGKGADFVCRGKMIEVCVDACEDVFITGLSFDYHRPTVSEFRIDEAGDGYLDLKVHKDSWYEIADGRIVWKGEGWKYDDGDKPLAQVLDPKTNRVWRKRSPLPSYTFEQIKPGVIRATGKGGLKAGYIYQLRKTHRDYCGVFTRRSKNIVWKDVHFKFIHGMGLVNQFSENLTFDGVVIKPDDSSGMTTAAWADCIQVSGCKGKVLVKDCVFSGAHDDAINIHGTHLRVVEKMGNKQIKVRFIHSQTYGFKAFNRGDEVVFVRWDSLATYAPNKVVDAKLIDPKNMVLTLEKPVPADLKEKDALENVTWTPEVHITGCDISRIPTRGFLITTRRKVVVEKNNFKRTNMYAILLEDDAKGWFESGCVRDMTIRNNRFFECAEPVINSNPQNSVPNDKVHQNIRVLDNEFILKGKTMVRAKSTGGLVVKGNTVYAKELLDDETAVKTSNCSDVTVSGNKYKLRSE